MGEVFLLVGVFAATFLVGVYLILKVPPRLHTPLMSMTNAVSGITVLSALVLLAGHGGRYQVVLAAVAVAMGAFNFIGGFWITDRMLRLFKKSGPSHD